MNSAVEHSGFEFLTLIKEGKLPHSNMANTIPMRLIEVHKGKIVYEVTPDERHLNTLGGVHGGLYATAIDTITGAAIHSVLEAGMNFGTTDLNVKMLRALKPNHTYRAEGQVISTGRTLLTAEGRIIDEKGKIYAYGSASCLVIK